MSEKGIFINNIGTMFEPTGYAKVNRNLVTELVQHGAQVRFTPLRSEGVRVPLKPQMESFLQSLMHTSLTDKHIVLFNYISSYFFREVNRYTIGLTMFECHRIPFSWARRCNQMDEIWVPSTFNQHTFAQSGVTPYKIRVMPLGVDTHIFRPDRPPLVIEGKREYTFLSIGSWDPRKGNDILLTAFYEEFAEEEDVCLIIKTRASSQEEINHQKAYVEHMAQQVSGRKRESVILVSTTDSWTEEKLAQLYNTANCYVLPTRGEGWNMTVMEAMAVGLPVITTNWSAHLDFINQFNGFLISVQGFSTAFAGKSRLSWAIPNKDHLRQLMRQVFTHQSEAKNKGQLGREVIHQHYTWAKSAERMLHRLHQISV